MFYPNIDDDIGYYKFSETNQYLSVILDPSTKNVISFSNFKPLDDTYKIKGDDFNLCFPKLQGLNTQNAYLSPEFFTSNWPSSFQQLSIESALTIDILFAKPTSIFKEVSFKQFSQSATTIPFSLFNSTTKLEFKTIGVVSSTSHLLNFENDLTTQWIVDRVEIVVATICCNYLDHFCKCIV